MTTLNEQVSVRYRCCEHCKEDTVHAVEVDGHEVPCNAPNSRDCPGRLRAALASDPTHTQDGAQA